MVGEIFLLWEKVFPAPATPSEALYFPELLLKSKYAL